MVVHAFNPVLKRQRQADLCEFKASLLHGVSSRTTRAVQRNPVWKTNKQTNSVVLSRGGTQYLTHAAHMHTCCNRLHTCMPAATCCTHAAHTHTCCTMLHTCTHAAHTNTCCTCTPATHVAHMNTCTHATMHMCYTCTHATHMLPT